jgi:hypothetical protein
MSIYDVRQYGAAGDGQADDTRAIQSAIDAAGQTGGLVELPPGTYVTGTVFLRSNVTVRVAAGATWRGLADPSAYPDIDPVIPSRMDITPWKAFLYAVDAENVTLCGEGTIHPGGEAACFQDGKGNSPNRPYGIHMVRCRRVTVRDLHLTNSAFWMQRYYGCVGLRLSGLTVYNHSNLNNDGVDIDGCRDVTVSDCRIDASDDALCFKSEGEQIVENVTVTNCVLSSFASALKLGTGSIGGFRRMSISNLAIRRSVSEEMTHGMGCWNGLMGIDLGNVDGGTLENVFISNVVMDGPETPIFMKLGERHRSEEHWPGAPAFTPGVTRNVRIDNVIAHNAGPIASAIVGYPGHRIENVSLSRITQVAGRPSDAQADFDVNIYADLYPMNRIFNQHLPAYGLYVRHAAGLALDDVSVHPADGEKRSAGYVFEDVAGLTLRNVRAADLGGDGPVVLRECTDVSR